jgi:hypothetical protein
MDKDMRTTCSLSPPKHFRISGSHKIAGVVADFALTRRDAAGPLLYVVARLDRAIQELLNNLIDAFVILYFLDTADKPRYDVKKIDNKAPGRRLKNR